MFLSELHIENFRMFGEKQEKLIVPFQQGLTALVGENDAGKTTIIDALRLALGTTDQDWIRLEDTDFHQSDTTKEIQSDTTKEIHITCKFIDLNQADKRAFVEYLTYEKNKDESFDIVFYVNWTAVCTGTVSKGRPFKRVEVRSGLNGNGVPIDQAVREMLRATYLRPLRDAEAALSAGRGSRLSQVLLHTENIKKGDNFDSKNLPDNPKSLSILGIVDFANNLLEGQESVQQTKQKIDQHLAQLALHNNRLKTNIKVGSATSSDEARLRQILEKLELNLRETQNLYGKVGLGSNNLLFMACELLLLAQESEGNKLLLIEEPEAHLHTQRQLRVMKYLQEQAKEKNVQVIVTTHSPNLASAIHLDNMVMVQNKRAFSLAKGKTKLALSDYRFLERFLDVTKANLFFARGVVIVEGDAENILLPALARLIGRDFTEYGVSIVNVGGVGLKRYARIFQRESTEESLIIPVACITDLDVMPDYAKERIDKKIPTKSDLGEEGLESRRKDIIGKADGQKVKTFVADEWTLEYDLAHRHPDLAKEVYLAARLAQKDEALAKKGEGLTGDKLEAELKTALANFETLKQEIEGDKSQNSSTKKEKLATEVYALFTNDTKASKTIAAQYLAERLEEIAKDDWRNILPPYLIQAIDYVTTTAQSSEESNHG